MEDEEFFPCVCCGTGWQTDTGFCQRCNDSNCVLTINAWKESGDGGT